MGGQDCRGCCQKRCIFNILFPSLTPPPGSGINRTNHELSARMAWPQLHDWAPLLPPGRRRRSSIGCAGISTRSKRQPAFRATSELRLRSAFPRSTAISAAGSAAARCTRSPPRVRRRLPLPRALRWRSRRDRCPAGTGPGMTRKRFLSSFRAGTCSGSPRISRSPRMARPMGPVSTGSASLPSG